MKKRKYCENLRCQVRLEELKQCHRSALQSEASKLSVLSSNTLSLGFKTQPR